MNKQECKGILNIVSGVKYKFMFVWQYLTYVTHFKAFYTAQRVFHVISELIFVLNIHKDTSLSIIGFIGSY